MNTLFDQPEPTTDPATEPAPEPNVQGVKVGDFFVCSWGYDQTNVDFYKVVALTAKSIKVQQWKSKHVEGEGHGDKVVPGDGPATYTDWSNVDQNADYWTQQEQKVERDRPILLKRVRLWSDRASFTVNSYSNAYAWDGKPEYQTAAGSGH